MALLNPFAKKPLLSESDTALVVDAIKASEKKTSGEIRVYAESRCRYVNPLDRALEVFRSLKMEETANRNAVLVYIATRDRQLAVYADEGIYEKAGVRFWNDAVATMVSHFDGSHYGQGIAAVVHAIGNTLQQHFPYDSQTDKNELPDDIVFGK